MNKKNAIIALIVAFAAACGYYFLSSRGAEQLPGSVTSTDGALSSGPSPEFDDATENADEPKQGGKQLIFSTYHPKDVEEIKKQVYGLCIEDIDDIPQLDSVVQTGNAPTRDLWAGGWMSVDDNKDIPNGFKLEPQQDGTFIFYPDEATTKTYTFFETPRTYTYDPEKKEFSWTMDYYGKTISHRVRFINENVVAMMLISGRKVTMDLYQRQPDQPQESDLKGLQDQKE